MDSQKTGDIEIVEVKPMKITVVKDLRRRIESLEQEFHPITDAETYADAQRIWKLSGQLKKEAEAARKEITKPIDLVKGIVMELFRPITDRIEAFDRKAGRDIKEFDDKILAEKAEAQRKAQEALDRDAEKERKKLEKKAEKAIAKGDTDKAMEFQQQAATVVSATATVERSIERPAGVSFRENWKAVVVDVNKVPREHMIPDQAKLDRLAKATKGQLVIDGVRFECERISVRGK